MKPILNADKRTFSADFNVKDRDRLKYVHVLATTCAKLDIPGAENIASGIEDMMGACGYEGDLETGETTETEPSEVST